MTPLFDGTIRDSKLFLDKGEKFKQYLTGLNGKRIQVTVEKIKHSRTNGQNRYLWGVCYKLIADHTGAETDEVHAALKFNFCPKRFIGNLVAPSSTAKLDTIAFTDYIEKVRRWAAEELSINIPDPGEVAA
jgi:hypothetical protein